MIVGGARWRWSLEEAGGAWRSWRGQIALLLIYGASLAGWPLFPRQCFFFRLLAGDEMASCFFFGWLFLSSSLSVSPSRETRRWQAKIRSFVLR